MTFRKRPCPLCERPTHPDELVIDPKDGKRKCLACVEDARVKAES